MSDEGLDEKSFKKGYEAGVAEAMMWIHERTKMSYEQGYYSGYEFALQQFKKKIEFDSEVINKMRKKRELNGRTS